MTTRTNRLSAIAIAVTLTATTLLATGSASAGGHGGGGADSGGNGYSPVYSKSPIVNTIHPIVYHPVHGPGSSHNPIVRHPLHGPGSSHDPIVVSGRDCDDPTTLCRRPVPSY